MIKKISFISLFLLCAIAIADAETSHIEEYKAKIQKILPVGWELLRVSEKAVPYNVLLQTNEKPGILFELIGPEIERESLNKKPLKISKTPEKESLKIWIMPSDYAGVESKIQGQFYKAVLIGSNKRISVYIKSFFSNKPTWESWKEDLIKSFDLVISQTFERQLPTISVQEAIRLAERYVADNHIDVSAHFISSANYVESGSLTNSYIGKGPYWHITYELVKPADGGQHFIFVYMDGKIGQMGGL